MQFALLGDAPDGLAAARALVETGGHVLRAALDRPAPEFAPRAVRHSDLEEILADPAIDLIIVAGKLAERGEQLRRSLQSERDVLCAVPCATSIDRVYEAALIQSETKKILLPLMPEGLHPVFERVRRWRAEQASPIISLKWECANDPDRTGFPGWTALRRLGGEISEVTGLAETERWDPKRPVIITGRFQEGGLLQITAGPGAVIDRLTLRVGERTAELIGALGRTEATLALAGELPETFTFSPWHELVAELDSQRNGKSARLSWQDAIRAHELDEALKRSIEKRRTETLDYQEVSVEAGSKGALTLIGCAMLWMILLIAFLSIWVPWIRWAIVPLIVIFLGLLAIRILGSRGQPPATAG